MRSLAGFTPVVAGEEVIADAYVRTRGVADRFLPSGLARSEAAAMYRVRHEFVSISSRGRKTRESQTMDHPSLWEKFLCELSSSLSILSFVHCR